MPKHSTLKSAKKPVLPGGALPDFLAWPVLAVIPLVCLVGAWTTPYLATPDELKAATSQVLLTLLLLVYYWGLRERREHVLKFSPPVMAFAALFLLGTVSLAWAANPDFWFYKWSRWFAGFVMFLFALQIRQSTLNLDRIFQACLAGGVITAVVGCAQQLFNLSLIPQTAFPASTFGNGNVAGEVMIFTAPLGLYFLFKPELSRRATWGCAIAMCLIAMYTFYTRTRAVWLSVLLEAALVCLFAVFDPRRADWLHWNRQKTVAAVTMALVFLVMINFDTRYGFQPFWRVAAYEFTSIAVDIGDNQGEEASERYLIWRSTQQIIKDSPWFGTGVGSFYEVENNGGYNNLRVLGVQRVHNDLLELAVDLGVAGLLCLAAIIVTFCRQLYLLMLHATGRYRLVYALLTIAVTGSMLDAQLAFPYELPVPLILMPLYMALVIRGAENFAPAEARTWRVGPWFNRASLAGAAAMLVIVTVINVQWLSDFRKLNQVLGEPSRNLVWKPTSLLLSQAHITGVRSAVDALNQAGLYTVANNILKPILEYWPNTVAHTISMIKVSQGLGRLEEAERWALRTIEVQPAETYLGELYLMEIYAAQGDGDKLVAVYTGLKDQLDESLAKYSNTLTAMHYTSILLQDYENTPRFYSLYVQRFGEMAAIEANHAVFLMNIGLLEEARPHMQRALALDARIPQAGEFNRMLADNTL